MIDDANHDLRDGAPRSWRHGGTARSARAATVAIAGLLSLVAAGCDRRIDVDFNYAFEQADYAWAEQLLRQGADIDARYLEAEGFTTLMMTARTDEDPQRIAWLLEHGADPNVSSFNGRMPLHVASSAGRAEQVRLLLAAGAKVDARTQAGDTALDIARENEHLEVARLIEEAGGRARDPRDPG